jgi:hypothetical protein
MLHYATPEQAREVYGAFYKRKDIFPHIRRDYVNRAVSEGRCVYDDGIIIIFQVYRKTTRVGTVQIPAGATMLHQILNTYTGTDHRAAWRVMSEFLFTYPDVHLAVRADNERARLFYGWHGMHVVGTVEWKNGTMPGVVYRFPRPAAPGVFSETIEQNGTFAVPSPSTAEIWRSDRISLDTDRAS